MAIMVFVTDPNAPINYFRDPTMFRRSATAEFNRPTPVNHVYLGPAVMQ